MLFTTNLLSLLLLATSTLSSPVPEPEPTAEAPEKRSLGGVYFCNDINWGAPCYHRTQEIAVCKDLSSTYAGKVSSIGPDKGTKCSVYSRTGCLPSYGDPYDGHLEITYPGIADLTKVNFNDKAMSVICYAD
ncbi:MAG: hypothetical protein LQ342_000550 [Letrouitia transgressa]|nr:MAG: hypothetical protein LQ342_000550 [Letrouitia transgressa]